MNLSEDDKFWEVVFYTCDLLSLATFYKKDSKKKTNKHLLMMSHFFSFLLFRTAPAASGSSQARGRIGATAAGLRHSHSNSGSEPHL